MIHGMADVGSPKVDSAAARLKDLNPDAAVKTYPFRKTKVHRDPRCRTCGSR